MDYHKQTKKQKGFILTAHSFDNHSATQIVIWLSTDKGPVKLVIANEKPIFFVEELIQEDVLSILSRLNISFTYKKLDLTTFSLSPVTGFYFDQIKGFYDARSLLEKSNITIFEGNFRLHERYLMERFIYGSLEFVGVESNKQQAKILQLQAKHLVTKNFEKKDLKKKYHHQKNYSSGDQKLAREPQLQTYPVEGYFEFSQVKIKPNDYLPTLKIISIDIECSEYGELYSIGFYSNFSQQTFQRVVMVRSQELNAIDDYPDYLTWVENEKELLTEFVTIIKIFDPDIIIGWNVINFDFRLLFKRAEKYKLKLKLGRGASSSYWRESRTEKNQGFISMEGRVVVDGIAAMKAESYSFPSFSLEAIAQHFLSKGKETKDVDNRMDAINHDFKFNQGKLAKYNLQDCVLVWDIFEKIKLLDYLIFRSQLTGLALDRAGGSVAAFTNLYLPKLHRQGYVSPNLPEEGGLASPGGYVMNSKPGLYKNVLVLDFKSLYPSIIRTYKIDPLGLIEGAKKPDDAIEGFRGGCFSRDKHILPEIITDLWGQRDQAKKDNDQARSQAIKIIMNSFYGVLGSGGCPFYDTKLASSITLRGHQIMQQTSKWIEEKGFEVIYGDTDSTFVLLEQDLSQQQANEIGDSLVKYINTEWELKLMEDHQLPCLLEIEFESYFSRFLMPTIRGSEQGSKKRYAGLLKKEDSETLIFKGLENVRSDWTELAKNFQRKLYQMIFHDQDPTAFILETVQQTLNGERDEELVYRKRLRRSLGSYIKNVPPHVKAARIADSENLKRNIPQKYQNKGWIRYLMTVNGPQPIEYVSSAVDYQFYIDRQIEPVADGILSFIGLSFQQLVDQQLGLF